VQIQLKKAKTIESLANFEPFKITLDDPTGISTTVATLSYLTIGAAFFATCCMINLICPSLFPWLIETICDAIQKMCCCCIKSSRNVIEQTFRKMFTTEQTEDAVQIQIHLLLFGILQLLFRKIQKMHL
jgi:hypothetical protein